MEYIGKIKDDYLLKEKNEIIIYGCGKMGKSALLFFEENGMADKVVGFCDRNTQLHGEYINGKIIYDIASCSKKHPHATYLIACIDVLNVLKQLERYHIKKIHITV